MTARLGDKAAGRSRPRGGMPRILDRGLHDRARSLLANEIAVVQLEFEIKALAERGA